MAEKSFGDSHFWFDSNESANAVAAGVFNATEFSFEETPVSNEDDLRLAA